MLARVIPGRPHKQIQPLGRALVHQLIDLMRDNARKIQPVEQPWQIAWASKREKLE